MLNVTANSSNSPSRQLLKPVAFESVEKGSAKARGERCPGQSDSLWGCSRSTPTPHYPGIRPLFNV